MAELAVNCARSGQPSALKTLGGIELTSKRDRTEWPRSCLRTGRNPHRKRRMNASIICVYLREIGFLLAEVARCTSGWRPEVAVADHPNME